MIVSCCLSSLHRFYRNRLAETFLLRQVSSAESETLGITPQDPPLLSKLRSKGATAPDYLINAAVNLTPSENPELRGRNCDYFLFSKHCCGGPVVGYRKTTICEAANPMPDLPGAGSCSGATGDADTEPEPRYSRAHFTLGRIVYPFDKVAQQRPIGWLVCVRLSVTGNEPQYVLDYSRRFPDFPHQSTLRNQVFDEDQFEAYRRLGEHVGDDLFADELLEELRYVDAGQAAELRQALGEQQVSVSGWVNALRTAFRL
jgi:hypothetical protein